MATATESGVKVVEDTGGEEEWGRVLSQHSPLASLHIDTNQSAGKPTYLPMNPPLQPIEKFFFSVENALLYALIQVQSEFHASFNWFFSVLWQSCSRALNHFQIFVCQKLLIVQHYTQLYLSNIIETYIFIWNYFSSITHMIQSIRHQLSSAFSNIYTYNQIF